MAESLAPIFDHETEGLDESSKIAVTLALTQTLNSAKLDASHLAKINLDPVALRDYLKEHESLLIRDFSQSEIDLYHRLVQQCCNSIVKVASSLPSFNEQTLGELLRRTDRIIDATSRVIDELNTIQLEVRRINSDPNHARFETNYLNGIINKLGRLELFGIDVSATSQRYSLEMAYITLRAAWTSGKKTLIGQRGFSVSQILSSSRYLLVRGEPGSGKTTLLQWIAIKSATRTFPNELKDWNGAIPFFVWLRQHVNNSLPSPSQIIKSAAPLFSDDLPSQWLYEVLSTGRAIFLIDGLDELPHHKHEEVHDWVQELIANFPKCRFVVTSRPYAVKPSWLDKEGFSSIELERMEPGIIEE